MWGASMPMAPSSANVGMGSWVEANPLRIVSDVFDGIEGRWEGRMHLLRSRSSAIVAALGAAIVLAF